jgi:hypothetical protein
MGTHTNDISSLPDFLKTPLLSRKSGSRLTRGTITGFPLATTRPVIPSPRR